MQTLGIDLSTDPKKVWTCVIDWTQSPPRITSLERLGALKGEANLIAGLVDRVVAFAPGEERLVAVDAPLGWPAAFVEAVTDWDDGDLQGFRKRPDLRLRATDRFVQTIARLTPMSVSTDRMGSTAMLLAEVLSRTARRLDRQGFERVGGRDGIVEVHPSSSLRMWTHAGGQPLGGRTYKSWNMARESLVIQIAQAGVELTPGQAAAMIDNVDALDAFVCALTARAVAQGDTLRAGEPVDVQQLLPKGSGQAATADSVEQLTERLDLARALQEEAARTAATEGWIHLPRHGDLATSLGTTPGSASWVPEPTPPPEPYRPDWVGDVYGPSPREEGDAQSRRELERWYEERHGTPLYSPPAAFADDDDDIF